MTALPPEVRRAAEPVGVGGFEIGYVTDDGLEHRVSLSQAWATPFESCSPIRRFTSHKGQRHLSGLWWSATTGGHVGFESWMERDHVMALDFDPTVGIASQPFWLILRQYLHRNADLATFTQDELDAIAAKLNHRPRRVLSWVTPAEAFGATEPKPLQLAPA